MLQRMTTYQFKAMLVSGDTSLLPKMTVELRDDVRYHAEKLASDRWLEQRYRDQAQLFIAALDELDRATDG